MKKSDLFYNLPKELIAHSPANPRDSSKLMIVDRESKKITHKPFYDLADILTPNDVLVFNNTKVFPARVKATKDTGGKVELLFLENLGQNKWKVMRKGSLRENMELRIMNQELKVVSVNKKLATVQLNKDVDLYSLLEQIGEVPLPPYIKNELNNKEVKEKYQTIYARNTGSAAAPTAGLHFTDRLINKLKSKGIQMEYVTLHVGLGTFLPIEEDDLLEHKMHSEYFEIDQTTQNNLKKAKKSGKRIISVGTTATRVLESDWSKNSTDIFIYPPYKFKFVDALITNFHLPESTLLALVFAFANEKLVRDAYKQAIKNNYRFYSFGDSMIIL